MAGSGSGCASASADDKALRGWRKRLRVHPAADLFPFMSEDELRALGEDIKANGLRASIVLNEGKLLDGRNRLDAMELVGIKFKIKRGRHGYEFSYDYDDEKCHPHIAMIDETRDGDPYNFVLSANLHRRHLTAEQKRELIAKVLRAKPEASNRKIAKQVKADDKTVASVRRDLESTAEIPQLEKTVGTDGKQRKSRAKKKPKPDSSLDKLFEGAVPGRVTESAEVSIEDRRADMARLDEPGETVVAEVDRRVSCVTNTILRHVEGLSRSDAERFFAALRDRLDEMEHEVLQEYAATSEAAE